MRLPHIHLAAARFTVRDKNHRSINILTTDERMDAALPVSNLRLGTVLSRASLTNTGLLTACPLMKNE
ncbi:hypothetical protein SAMN02745223_03028 [Devosia limi DSM 17137]|uniref:Uncharacterized protein n=1 Tax=Devosia limi DSM 17137 TaxID=1121477 RepID=A0A1M5CRX6_9HYPH|nr:hypothetical protein SAMN02745223_03028 [Devosia limi DSM 17137]